MGGIDKGLALLHRRPLIAWVAERIAPQVSEMFISANRNLDQYRKLGYPVLPDATPLIISSQVITCAPPPDL